MFEFSTLGATMSILERNGKVQDRNGQKRSISPNNWFGLKQFLLLYLRKAHRVFELVLLLLHLVKTASRYFRVCPLSPSLDILTARP
jgi:hypothetical protein